MVSKKQLNLTKIILITGQSGAGKSFFSSKLSEIIKESIIIKTDDYYHTGIIPWFLSKTVNGYYDKLISINISKLNKDIRNIITDKKVIYLPKYNFKNKTRTYMKINNKNINFVIVEGIFAFKINKLIYKNAKVKILIEDEKELCFQRRYKRDIQFRGRKINEISIRFNQGWKIFNKLKYNKNKDIININSRNYELASIIKQILN